MSNKAPFPTDGFPLFSGHRPLEFVTLVLPQPQQLPLMGLPSLEWQGKRLTFPTTGDYTLGMSQHGIATVTISIPVVVRVEEP